MSYMHLTMLEASIVILFMARMSQPHSHDPHKPNNETSTSSTGVVSILDRLATLNHSLASFQKTMKISKVLHSIEGLKEYAHDLIQHLINDGGIEEYKAEMETIRKKLEQLKTESDDLLLVAAADSLADMSLKMAKVDAEWQEMLQSYSQHDEHSPVAGEWSTWSKYSACNASYGQGTQTRTRTCEKTHDAAEVAVWSCVGLHSEAKECTLRTCDSIGKTQTTLSPRVAVPIQDGITSTPSPTTSQLPKVSIALEEEPINQNPKSPKQHHTNESTANVLTLENLPAAVEEFKRQHRICTHGGLGQANADMFGCVKDLEAVSDENICSRANSIVNGCAHDILVKCYNDTEVRKLQAILLDFMGDVLFENTGQTNLLKKCQVWNELENELQVQTKPDRYSSEKCTAEQVDAAFEGVNKCTHRALAKRDQVSASDPTDRRKLFCNFIEEAIITCPKSAGICINEDALEDWTKAFQKEILSFLKLYKANSESVDYTFDISECEDHPALLAIDSQVEQQQAAAPSSVPQYDDFGGPKRLATSDKLNSYIGEEWNALHVAAIHGNLEEAKTLLKSGVDVDRLDAHGQTPLYLACQEGHLAVAQFLVEKGADVNHVSSDGHTPLDTATLYGHLAIVTLLIGNGAKVERADGDGFTPLHVSSKVGNIAVAKLLLEKGAYVNVTSNNGTTPLHLASKEGHIIVVDLLIKNGAAIDKGDANGITALYLACRSGHLQVAQTLLSNGADINEKSNLGYSAIRGASINGHLEVVKLLIGNGAEVNVQDKEGLTPLEGTCFYGHIQIAQLLLDHGADVDRADNDGFTPLYVASQNGYIELVKLLIEKGADVNKQINNGGSPLHGAAGTGQLAVVELLIERGAAINARNHKLRFTPLFSAADNNQTAVAQFLIEKGASLK